jgi:hypothetical protein
MESINHFLKNQRVIRKSIRVGNKILKNNNMKKSLILATMLLTFGIANAQKIFSVSNQAYADVKVFVVDNQAYADLLVFKVSNQAYAGKNDGKWYFVDNQAYADKKIFFVSNQAYADLKIFFVNNQAYAGWKNASKKSLMY